MTLGPHTLVVYGASPRADAALRAVVEAASDHDGRLTVVAMVAQEPESNRCCDTRSVLWNDVVRGLAAEDLDRAVGSGSGRGGRVRRARVLGSPRR
jgi:hypothetical protein